MTGPAGDHLDYEPSDELRHVNIIAVKVVDERGRTVCRLQKSTYYDQHGNVETTETWGAPSKPIKPRPPGVPFNADLAARAPMDVRDGQRYLVLPGLTCPIADVAASLDRIAAALELIDPESGAVIVTDPDAAILTVGQLRRYIDS